MPDELDEHEIGIHNLVEGICAGIFNRLRDVPEKDAFLVIALVAERLVKSFAIAARTAVTMDLLFKK